MGKKEVIVKRAGGKWEGIGFLLIAAGVIAAFFKPGLAATLIGIGLVVFIIGRFK